MQTATPQYQYSPSHGQSFTDISPAELLAKAPTKAARVLAYLLVPCNSLNRFEAEDLGDHCLNSTIAALANRRGLEFQREPEKVPNCWGTPCDVIRYSLPESQHRHARAVLEQLFKRTNSANVTTAATQTTNSLPTQG